MNAKLISLALAAVIASSTGALAHKKYDPDARAADEAAKIEAGRESGSITYFEGLALRREQQAIADREAQLKSDGYLSQKDRRELKQLQDQADEHVTQAATNSWRRWSILPRVGR